MNKRIVAIPPTKLIIAHLRRNNPWNMSFPIFQILIYWPSNPLLSIPSMFLQIFEVHQNQYIGSGNSPSPDRKIWRESPVSPVFLLLRERPTNPPLLKAMVRNSIVFPRVIKFTRQAGFCRLVRFFCFPFFFCLVAGKLSIRGPICMLNCVWQGSSSGVSFDGHLRGCRWW